MFCTTLSYITLRLLGEGVDGGDEAMDKARKWILDRGGITCIPSWGIMWLSVRLLLFTLLDSSMLSINRGKIINIVIFHLFLGTWCI